MDADAYRQLAQSIAACKVRLNSQTTFFGLLMQHVTMAADTACPTACTDGERIYFGIPFCTDLDEDELLFVMWHELMHIVLGHCFRSRGYDNRLYNVAADIVVNSTILHAVGIAIDINGQPLMHLAPNGKKGFLYTAEEVYEMLLDSGYVPPQNAHNANGDQQQGGGNGEASGAPNQPRNANTANTEQTNDGAQPFWDDHSTWKDADYRTKSEWNARIMDAANVVMHDPKAGKSDREMAERFYDQLAHPTLDWRLLLHNFVQPQPYDYSFTPPDRRYDAFFLPDFNDTEDSVTGLWLAVDTSGSIRNHDIARAFAEIRGGIEQFGGNMRGLLSFFDDRVTQPVPFESVEDVAAIRPRGGGGTSFHAIFDYYDKHLQDEEITGIIIFTDGYATFPPESAAQGVPVFWLINNRLVTPPWGVVARYLPQTDAQ